MPNQMRSMPAACTVGSSTAMVSTTIEMPSRKQPRMMKKKVSTISSMPGERPSPLTHSASWRGRPM